MKSMRPSGPMMGLGRGVSDELSYEGSYEVSYEVSCEGSDDSRSASSLSISTSSIGLILSV